MSGYSPEEKAATACILQMGANASLRGVPGIRQNLQLDSFEDSLSPYTCDIQMLIKRLSKDDEIPLECIGTSCYEFRITDPSEAIEKVQELRSDIYY